MNHYKSKNQKFTSGFTLVEILVSMTITILLSMSVIQGFSRSRGDVIGTSALIRGAIREAQGMALAGLQVGGVYRCGFGVHFILNPPSYTIFAGPNSANNGCSGYGKIYQSGSDTIISTRTMPGNIFIEPSSGDIYFEPPLPTTSINGVSTYGVTGTIVVRRIEGSVCPSNDCASINVSTSGTIE